MPLLDEVNGVIIGGVDAQAKIECEFEKTPDDGLGIAIALAVA